MSQPTNFTRWYWWPLYIFGGLIALLFIAASAGMCDATLDDMTDDLERDFQTLQKSNEITVNPDPSILSDDEQAQLARWEERNIHWDNLGIIRSYSLHSLFRERISMEQAKATCDLLPTWKGYTQDAIDYIVEYKRVEPEKVKLNPALYNLEKEARHRSDGINEMQANCDEHGITNPDVWDVEADNLDAPTALPTTLPWNEQEIRDIPERVRNDPCFKGRILQGTRWTYIWDDECQRNKPK